ncbi:MAG: hypothetical protein ACREIC_09075, partial [Limisphaerales bacterium]
LVLGAGLVAYSARAAAGLEPSPQSINTPSNALSTAAIVPAYTSPWAGEVTKMAQAGISEQILRAYVQNTPGTFNLKPEQIIFLRDLGVSDDVIGAMLRHDQQVALGYRPVIATTVPSSAALLQSWFTQPAPSLASMSPTPAAGGQPLATNLPSSVTVTSPVVVPAANSPNQGAFATEPAGTEVQAEQSRAVCQRVTPAAAAEPEYPVREPYPVELTAPIAVYRIPHRVPNVIVWEMFP